MEHKNYRFCKKRTVVETGTTYFSCVKFRAGCPARLVVKKGGAIIERNAHCCDQDILEEVADVRRDMSLELQDRAIKEFSVAPGVLWQRVFDETVPSITRPLSTGATGGDTFRAVEATPVRSICDSDPRPFLQFSMAHPTTTGIQRMLCFGHPDLLRILRYPQLTLFIDGTFSVVPKGFSQCLIAMVYDPSVDVYVPLLYVLVNSKSQETYWRVLEQLIMASDRLLEPRDVTCDFELALINAVIEQFPTANIVGCHFHWKQALRRKMIELKIPKEQIADAMKSGKLDVLTVIPAEEVLDKGLRYVRSIIDETETKTKWTAFWKYFVRTWTKRFDMSLWNVSQMRRNNVSMTNRTNNPLEKYNRDFAARIGAPHPSILVFIEAAKKEAHSYVKLLDDIKHGRQSAPAHARSVNVEVPGEYTAFE
ncbi:hypothetical protein PPTG_23761 [Phytophthora nicotianae INRA-310]|uniref:MULE transposase domain-containing protein n=1 Tax=Phytophthora nicotianae (strain INRA-310) TaxID=761204 RepID=W2PTR7_PHYN3|nr:hypothetical protein PPTG_23761 [Phytophthora nicotianae INRA-310]ETN03634.1 hypothetical protein PPTG_23761 [Phytophthora nicotianae INRA-310]